MDSFNDKRKLVSEFNEASFQIMRLHELWLKANLQSVKGDLIGWKWTLDSIWRELAADAIVKDKEKYFMKLKLLNSKIAQSKGSNLYTSLDGKHIFLKTLQEDLGKGGKKKSEFENIM